MKPEEKLLKLCESKNLTIAFAESCTGGALSARLTKIPGASKCFAGALVAYQNTIKSKLLTVPEAIIQKFGDVSEQTAKIMLENCMKLFNVDLAVSVTGIAGPDGGSLQIPVGTIFVAMGGHEVGLKQMTLHLSGDREAIIEQAVQIVFENLVSFLC